MRVGAHRFELTELRLYDAALAAVEEAAAAAESLLAGDRPELEDCAAIVRAFEEEAERGLARLRRRAEHVGGRLFRQMMRIRIDRRA